MSDRFSLKDHLFNAETVGRLAGEYTSVIRGFDIDSFVTNCVDGFKTRELLQRIDWIADCLEPHLPTDFPAMADMIEAALPPELDPALTDDDFGHFIHAVPGVLAVRHGLEDHRERALDLLHAATRRFSMEAYIRPFIDRWPEETFVRLERWTTDPNYHVRRLVSEGTRARLPWSGRLKIDPLRPLPLLDRLYRDPTRYVTRSVANHLNDLTKTHASAVYERLENWSNDGASAELAWLAQHALRSEIKAGDPRAMAALGYRADALVTLDKLGVNPVDITIGDVAEITFSLHADAPTPVIVDYVMELRKANGSLAPKVYKLKQTEITAGTPLKLKKRHRFKGDATTFTLYPGPQRLSVQVNGRILGSIDFTLHA